MSVKLTVTSPTQSPQPAFVERALRQAGREGSLASRFRTIGRLVPARDAIRRQRSRHVYRFKKNTEPVEAADAQSVVNAYFRQEASYWAEIYHHHGIKEAIHQERLRAALAMADSLRLPGAARVLDIGCGAGLATVALAGRGFLVEAIDPVGLMIDATRRRAMEAGVGDRVTTRMGDVHAVPFADRAFDLVVALGVLPWLPQVEEPLREMARVLRPGGCMIVTVDTRWQLRQLLDPLASPLTQGPRRLAANMLGRSSHGIRSHVTSLRAFRRALAAEGLEEATGLALGFGPFTLFKREVLPHSVGLMLHDRLQSMANRGAPIVRSTGSQYLVLAKKRDAGSNGSQVFRSVHGSGAP
jgi:ubiquinone/menaquinone biosynthesis C-methylase UbiE